MDGLSLSAVVYELNSIVGGRIEKVQQPERDELLISIHAAGGSYRLLLSASPENCRIVLTDEKKPSPAEAPAFLMLLRKYLTGARIEYVEQPYMDRVVEIGIEALNELRDDLKLGLICEVMGRHSNIILVQREDDKEIVLDAIRRVTPSVSSARLILPKLEYEYPPSKKKRDPRMASADEFCRVLKEAVKPAGALSECFYGLSPAVAGRLLSSLGFPEDGPEEAAERLVRFYSEFVQGSFRPCIVKAAGRSVCTLPFLPVGEEYEEFGSMSEAVNAFYGSRAYEESIRRRTSSYEHVIKNAAAKLEKKLGIFSEAISSEEENERIRLFGELITANLYSIPPRADRVVLQNYYLDPPEPVEIPLDPLLSPADNAQRYYTRYRKAKLTRDHAVEMQKATADELSYLEELLYTLTCCESESELNEIRQELVLSGLVKELPAGKAGRKAGAVKTPPSKPLCFTSRDGIPILVGKNNRQNDKLTLSTAASDDTWLHVKDIHGSHVIIKAGRVPDATLYDAAVLAAYYSKARGSGSVPVDYTLVKYVKKPAGAKPGMVIYTHQHTVYVAPDEEHIRKLSGK